MVQLLLRGVDVLLEVTTAQPADVIVLNGGEDFRPAYMGFRVVESLTENVSATFIELCMVALPR